MPTYKISKNSENGPIQAILTVFAYSRCYASVVECSYSVTVLYWICSSMVN
jgi:hypothetical protein